MNDVSVEGALHEEMAFNALRILATNADAASPLSRTLSPPLLRLQSLFCSERIEPITNTAPDGCPIRGYWIGSALDPVSEVVIFYIHGGAFVAGHPLQSCHGLADLMHVMYQEMGVMSRVCAIEYPLAPEHPYPAALEACVRAVRWLVDVIGARKIVVMGDSAGGNLSLATLLYLRDKFPAQSYLHHILGCIPISPFVDFLGPRTPPSLGDFDEDHYEPEVGGITTDYLGLPMGRIAVRYYLGTKMRGWYTREGGWPNPWDTSQWDGGWHNSWDEILGLLPKLPPPRSDDKAASLVDSVRGRRRSTSSDPDKSSDPERRNVLTSARSRTLRRLSRHRDRSSAASSEQGLGQIDIAMADLEDVHSDAGSDVSGHSAMDVWTRRRSFSGIGGDEMANVPFPDVDGLPKPYYRNRELSDYDLERIYLTHSLSPYVSPYRAASFAGLPPLLFLVGQREMLYGDIIKCVRKARRTVAMDDARAGNVEGGFKQKRRGWGRVDVLEEVVGVHVYLLLPERLVGGKGIQGLREIGAWVADVARERREEEAQWTRDRNGVLRGQE
ncbi:hypothetical protein HDU93_006721 [Gonapodya sp. JEL0774]|nr:hypothetical protein HDU93_006721 [Gonapodya sp. JEL0774]